MRYADEQELSFSIERFQGIDQGLEGNDTPMHVSRDAENCDTAGGVLKLARGWAEDDTIGAALGPIRSLMNFYRNNADGSVTTKMVAATDTGLWQRSGTNWLDIAGGMPITSGRFTHVNYQNKDTAMIVLANGTDNVCSWSGSGTIAKLAANAAWVQGQPMWDQSSNTVRLTQHGLKEDEQVVFDKHKGTLPTNISEKDTYFVYDTKPDTFRVSATKTGGPVNLKGEGKVGWRVARAKWLGNGTPLAHVPSNTITLAAHGLQPDDAVVFDHFSGSLPGGIKGNTIYYAIITSATTFKISKAANNPEDLVDITSEGSGDWRVRRADPTTWLPGALSASNRTSMFTLTNHGLKEKDANNRPTSVEFAVDPSAVLPGGLVAGRAYYVKVVNAGSFQLKAAATDSATVIDITSHGVSGWTMRRIDADEWSYTVPSIDLKTNTFTLANHGFSDNTAIVFGVADENSYLPDGLFAGHIYYAKWIDNNKFSLLATPGAYTPVNITTAGIPGWGVKRFGATSWLAAPSLNIETNEITIASHGLSNGTAVVLGLDESRMLPGGLTAGYTYYVRDVVEDESFRLAASPNGAAINLTGAGRSGWRIRPVDGVWKYGLPKYKVDTNVISLPRHGFTAGTAVVVDISTADSFMPGGIIAHNGTPQGKYYYLVKVTKSTFMVSETPGGTPVKLTSNGTNAYRMRLSRENRPMGGSVALHAERIWCAGERTRPNSAFFSDDLNPTNWAIGAESAGEIVKPTWDGDAVTAVANLFDSVVVFKARSIFRVAGTSPKDYQVTPVLSTTGTVSPRSICQWQNAAFFLSPIGIMAYDGSKCERLGGDGMGRFWARLNASRDALAGACATVDGGRLLMAVPVDGSAQNNAVVEFDIGRGTFMVRTGVNVSAWLPGDPLRFASGNRVYIWGRNGDGTEALTYGGQPIPMRWTTPETDFGDRGASKTVTGVLVSGRGGALQITVRSAGRQAAKTVTLPEAGGTAKAAVRLRGRTLSLELANVNGSAVELTGLTVLYEREEDA